MCHLHADALGARLISQRDPALRRGGDVVRPKPLEVLGADQAGWPALPPAENVGKPAGCHETLSCRIANSELLRHVLQRQQPRSAGRLAGEPRESPVGQVLGFPVAVRVFVTVEGLLDRQGEPVEPPSATHASPPHAGTGKAERRARPSRLGARESTSKCRPRGPRHIPRLLMCGRLLTGLRVLIGLDRTMVMG